MSAITARWPGPPPMRRAARSSAEGLGPLTRVVGGDAGRLADQRDPRRAVPGVAGMSQRLVRVVVDERARGDEVPRDGLGRLLLQAAQVTTNLGVQLGSRHVVGERRRRDPDLVGIAAILALSLVTGPALRRATGSSERADASRSRYGVRRSSPARAGRRSLFWSPRSRSWRSPDPRPCAAEPPGRRASSRPSRRCEHRGIGDRRRDPTTDGRLCRPVGPGTGLRSGLDSPSLGPTRPDGGTRRSARRGPGSRSAGRGRTADRHCLRRSGRWSRRRGFGIRGRPTGIPTTDRLSGIPTIRRGPRRRAATGRPRRIGVVRPPGTGLRQPGGIRAPARPSGNPIRRGLLPGIRDRPTDIHLGRCCIHRGRRTGRSFDHCGVHRGRRRGSPARCSRRGIRRPPSGDPTRPGLGSPRRPCDIPNRFRFRFRGRRGRCTGRRIHGGRHGTGDGPADPAAVYHRHLGRRPCVLRPADRRGHGRSWVGRRWVGRPCAGCRRVGVASSVVTAVVPAAVASVAAGSPVIAPAAARLTTAAIVAAVALTALGPGAAPAVLPPTAVVALASGRARPGRSVSALRSAVRTTGSTGTATTLGAALVPAPAAPVRTPARVHRRDGSDPSRCRPCPARRRGDQTRHARRRADRRDRACRPNLDGLRAPHHDHCLADGYRRSHPRYS